MPPTPGPLFTAPTPPSSPHSAHLEALSNPCATHTRLVSALVHLLFALGFRGIHSGTRDRFSLSGFVGAENHHPDVTARSGRDTLDVFAVETATSLTSETTVQRLRALATAADAKGAGLWLAVPPEARTEAALRLQEWGVSARVICV